MNTISEKMGFILSQCDAPVTAQSWIEIIFVREDREDKGYETIRGSHTEVYVRLSCTGGCL